MIEHRVVCPAEKFGEAHKPRCETAPSGRSVEDSPVERLCEVLCLDERETRQPARLKRFREVAQHIFLLPLFNLRERRHRPVRDVEQGLVVVAEQMRDRLPITVSHAVHCIHDQLEGHEGESSGSVLRGRLVR